MMMSWSSLPFNSLLASTLVFLLLLIVGRNGAQQGHEQCTLNHMGNCNGSSNLKEITFGKLSQRLESIQLDMSIIESELSCKTSSKLLNETRSTITAIRSVDFYNLLGDGCLLSGVGLENYCCGAAPCDCNTLLKSCMGAHQRFFTHDWRELLDSVRTSLRILLSQHPCSLSTSSELLSKLHSGRDLQHWMQCSSAKSCSPIRKPVTSPAKSSSYANLSQLSSNLRMYWPTTTVTMPSRNQPEDFEGSGQNDQENYSGDGFSDLITDDEDLLSGELGSGEYTSTERTTTTTTRRPPPGKAPPPQKAAATNFKADTMTLTLVAISLARLL